MIEQPQKPTLPIHGVMPRFSSVLSLFDGMSCGQIALNRVGIEYDNYFSSEIDKHAIKVTQTNYPNTIQLGDVTKVKGSDLPKIDLLIGGSPCQGFSFAGKGLNFEDPRSKLFFEFVRLKNETQPKFWLLENVKMKKEHESIINRYLGVEPIIINSSLLSAQNRVRYYWTNIPGIKQPDDKMELLTSIIEDGVVDRDKSYCIDANYYKGGNLYNYFVKSRRQLVFCSAMRGRYVVDGKRQDGKMLTKGLTKQRIEIRYDGKTNALTTVAKDNNIVYGVDGRPYYNLEEVKFRKLTPIECERLQTVPDNYTDCVSDTQRYKMLGNGWTVDVIAHIFGSLLNGA
jgi:DNA-cytosine methyltransferase